MGLLDTGSQMTIITGPHRGRGKLTALRGFGDKPGDSQQTVSYVLMGEALFSKDGRLFTETRKEQC